jgi:hypothetical protein
MAEIVASVRRSVSPCRVARLSAFAAHALARVVSPPFLDFWRLSGPLSDVFGFFFVVPYAWFTFLDFLDLYQPRFHVFGFFVVIQDFLSLFNTADRRFGISSGCTHFFSMFLDFLGFQRSLPASGRCVVPAPPHQRLTSQSADDSLTIA